MTIRSLKECNCTITNLLGDRFGARRFYKWQRRSAIGCQLRLRRAIFEDVTHDGNVPKDVPFVKSRRRRRAITAEEQRRPYGCTYGNVPVVRRRVFPFSHTYIRQYRHDRKPSRASSRPDIGEGIGGTKRDEAEGRGMYDGFISYRLKGTTTADGGKHPAVAMATEPAPCELDVYLNARELRDVIFTPLFCRRCLPLPHLPSRRPSPPPSSRAL